LVNNANCRFDRHCGITSTTYCICKFYDDNLWVDGSGFDGESEFHRNSKGQMLHEWIREKQSFFVTEVGDDEDYLGNKTKQR